MQKLWCASEIAVRFLPSWSGFQQEAASVSAHVAQGFKSQDPKSRNEDNRRREGERWAQVVSLGRLIFSPASNKHLSFCYKYSFLMPQLTAFSSLCADLGVVIASRCSHRHIHIVSVWVTHVWLPCFCSKDFHTRLHLYLFQWCNHCYEE